MSGALLCLAAGVLAWPDTAARRRARLGPRTTGWTARFPSWPDSRLGPVLAAAGAVAIGAATSTVLVAGLAAGGAALGARAWAGRRRSAAEEARSRLLVAALGALAADLRGGRPLETAAASAAGAVGDRELAGALLRAARGPAGPTAAPARAGPDGEALDRLAAAVRLSARTGASLADVVTAVEEDLRARSRHRLELTSAVAAPRASAMLLAGLPVLGLAMGAGIGADPWHVLTRTGTGQVLLVLGAALEAAGVAWSRRLVVRATRGASPGLR